MLALGVSGSAAAQLSGRTAAYEALPAGTVLKVRLNERLNSAQVQPGHRFHATVASDEDRSGLPTGTRVEGVVRESRAASKQQPGVLDVDFTEVELPNGRAYPISGTLSSLDADSVTRADDGRLVSTRSSSKNRVKFIGYGAGAGALIGLLTKGNLLQSTLLGAAGGFVYSQLKKDKANGGYRNVDLREGAEFGVRLDQRFAYVPTSSTRSDSQVRRDRYDQGLSTPTRRSDGTTARRDRTLTRERTSLTLPDRVWVDNRSVNFGNARPQRSGTALLVPLEPVLTAAGLRHIYNPLSRELSISSNAGTARTTLGSNFAWINDERVEMEEPARRIDGVLYVPERFMELALGMRAYWDETGRTLRFLSSDADRNVSPLRNERSPG